MPSDPKLYGARGRYHARNRQGQFVTGGSGVEWKGLEVVDQMFGDYGDQAHSLRIQGGDELARAIQVYMKEHAPWKDRTKKARQALTAIAIHDAQVTTVAAGYSGTKVGYAFFLENYTYNGVSYAIVRPTIEMFADIMGATVRDILK